MTDDDIRHALSRSTSPVCPRRYCAAMTPTNASVAHLLSCKLMPGSTVTESQLMSEYDIGKTSCRIALVRLVHEGFVRSLPRQGYRIAAITLKDVEEVFALRVQLEPLAARLACGRVDVELLRRLEAACRVPHPERALSAQIDVFLDANREFHLAIAAASGNERLHRTLASLLDEMSRLVALGFGVQVQNPRSSTITMR